METSLTRHAIVDVLSNARLASAKSSSTTFLSTYFHISHVYLPTPKSYGRVPLVRVRYPIVNRDACDVGDGTKAFLSCRLARRQS